jgi:cell shape-determining protein MreC
MSKKEVLKTSLIYVYPIIVIGLLVYMFFQEKEVVINYPDTKTSDITYNPIYLIIEMPKHVIDVVEVYIDTFNQEHQVYADTLDYKSDSLEVYLVNSVDVNIEKKQATFTKEDFKIKLYEKVITKIVEVPTEITKYADTPYYRNNWFWAFIIENLAIFAIAIIAVFL